jgi:hypothetical protein
VIPELTLPQAVKGLLSGIPKFPIIARDVVLSENELEETRTILDKKGYRSVSLRLSQCSR